LEEKHKRNRKKRRTSQVSRIFSFLRFHFYPSVIATLATKCGECDEREVEMVSGYSNEGALLSLVAVISACLLSFPRVMAFVSTAVTVINRGLPL
jgi:hypothetical protein